MVVRGEKQNADPQAAFPGFVEDCPPKVKRGLDVI
jgi:hypothetical protein